MYTPQHEVEIRKFMSQMVGRAHVRVPIHVRWCRGSGEKDRGRKRYTLVRIAELVVASSYSVPRLEACWQGGLFVDPEEWKKRAMSMSSSTFFATRGSMVVVRMFLLFSREARLTLGNIHRGHSQVKDWRSWNHEWREFCVRKLWKKWGFGHLQIRLNAFW
jgi:hypothetical protein